MNDTIHNSAHSATDALRTTPGFISLRWKSALKLTALLLLVMTALSWRFYYRQESQFVAQLQDSREQHERLLKALLHSHAQQLLTRTTALMARQTSRLQAASRQADPAAYLQQLGQTLAKSPQLANSDSLQPVELYNRQGQPITRFTSNSNPQLPSWVDTVNRSATPMTALDCHRLSCAFTALVPVFQMHQRVGVLAVSTPLSSLTQHFRQLTLASVDIADELGTDNSDLPQGNFSTPGQLSQALLGLAKQTYPDLRYRQQSVVLERGNDQFSLSAIAVRDQLASNKYFVVTQNITAQRQENDRELLEDILLSAAALLMIVLVLIRPLLRSIDHIVAQTSMLGLLGQKQFQAVRQHLSPGRNARRSVDELDRLNEATTTLSFQLESLEKATELRANEMERLSLFDPLTGLANRHLFQYETEQEIQRFNNDASKTPKADAGKAKDLKCAVILLDLDKFKRVNDSLGHQQGDLLLSQVASRLKKATRSLGLAARLSGNEFAILVRNVKTSAHVEVLCQKICQLVGKPITLGQNNVIVSCSIGAALVAPAQSVHDLIKHAEIAMHKAKEVGGNQYQLFNAAMETEARNILSLESEIRRGFANDEYTLYLQPKVNMDNEIEGFEALIRWDHPDRGILPPAEFVPAMEEMGFISRLDNLVLEASCRQLHVWRTHFPDKSIAVNISSTHFTDRNFLVFLQQCLKKYPIDPKKLELEITETLLMENMSAGLEVIKQIKALGVNITIDDFGTGYSSLSYLKKLPVDTLKIDREFIKDIPDSESDMQISSVIIFLAKQLGFKVVAEGVETSEQLVFLKANHCDLAQGFYFSKPIPAHKAMILMESQRLVAN